MPEPQLRLTEAAQADLDANRKYTEETWGTDPWLAYFRDMAETMERLLSRPQIGRPRDMLARGVRSLPVREHILFYLVAEAGDFVILRILHARQNAAALRWAVVLEGL